MEPKPELETEKMDEQDRNERDQNEIFYHPWSSLPSCFNLLCLGSNVSLKLEPNYIQILPKFTGLQDAYLFLSEFKKVCNMIHFHNINIDVVKMRFAPFALKDNTKYSLLANSILNWNDFV